MSKGGWTAVQLKAALENWHLTLYEPRREKPAFCICENKDADHLHGNHTADQRLCCSAHLATTVNKLIFTAINFCGFVFIGIFAAIYFCRLKNWDRLF